MLNINDVTASIYDYLRSVLESGFGVIFIILTAINLISLIVLLWQFKKKHSFTNNLLQRFVDNSLINHLALLLFEAIKVQIICDANYFKGDKEDKVAKKTINDECCTKQTSYVLIFYYKMRELFQSKIYFKFRFSF